MSTSMICHLGAIISILLSGHLYSFREWYREYSIPSPEQLKRELIPRFLFVCREELRYLQRLRESYEAKSPEDYKSQIDELKSQEQTLKQKILELEKAIEKPVPQVDSVPRKKP